VQELTAVPDTRPKRDLVLKRMQGDPLFLNTVAGFFTAWSTGKLDEALNYFAPQSLSCVALSLEGNPPEGDEAARNRLRQGLDKVYQAFSQAKDIDSFVQPVEFTHPDLRIIDHPKANRISLAGLPDHMGAAYGCDKPLTEVAWQHQGNNVYGNYYAAAIRLNLTGEDSAVLYLLWAKDSGVWKITAFYVLTT
jgi:hypothetical protein